jgi:hypothetical protein
LAGWAHANGDTREAVGLLREVKRMEPRLMAPFMWIVLSSTPECGADAVALLDEGLRMHPDCPSLLKERARRLSVAPSTPAAPAPTRGVLAPAGEVALLAASGAAIVTAGVTAAIGDPKSAVTDSAVSASGVSAWDSGRVEGWIGGVLSDGGPLQALCQSIVSVNDIDGPKLLAMDSENWKDFGLMNAKALANIAKATEQLRNDLNTAAATPVAASASATASALRLRLRLRLRRFRCRCPSHSGADEVGD